MANRTREILLDVARQLFSVKGVAHTTMNDIAAASAKGRRTIYTYFKNKKEIYAAVLEDESDHLVSSLLAVMGENTSADEKLRKFLKIKIERGFHEKNDAVYKSWLKFDSRRVEKVRYLAQVKENEMLQKILSAGIADGIFNPMRVKLLKGFIESNISFSDALKTGESLESVRNSIESFIDFVVSDIIMR